MTEPSWMEVAAPRVQLRALTWGPDSGPIALCLHRPAEAADAVSARCRRRLHDSRFHARGAVGAAARLRAAVVEHAGHFLHLERPDEVVRRVVEFLRT
jgi:hypothetical protein